MTLDDRKDLFTLLRGLSIKLSAIAEESDDINTSDELHKLVEVIDETTDVILRNI